MQTKVEIKGREYLHPLSLLLDDKGRIIFGCADAEAILYDEEAEEVVAAIQWLRGRALGRKP